MSKGVTFYFVRHGETFMNRYNRIQGWIDAFLTDKGRHEASASGRGLKDVKFDAVYTSDLKRTIDTAQLILDENIYAEGLEIQPMPEFREVFFGEHEGLPSKEIWEQAIKNIQLEFNLPEVSPIEMRHVIDHIHQLDKSGDSENYIDLWQRIETGLLRLLHRHAGTNEKILVVSHGLTIHNLIYGLVADFEEREALANASVSVVKYQDGQFRLLKYNQTDHFIYEDE